MTEITAIGPPMPGMCEPKTKRKGPTPEQVVQKAILKYLSLCRIGKVTRNNVGMVWTGGRPGAGRPVRFGTVGQADLTVEIPDSPMCIHIEVKAPGGKTTPAQDAWLAAQRKRGHICLVASSVDQVADALAAAGFDVPRPVGRKGRVT